MTDHPPFCYPFPRPAVTADVACIADQDGASHILLIERNHPPFAGHWALPGGFVNQDEALDVAAARELAEETTLTGVHLEQVGAYGDPGRDPRGHTVTVAFLARLDHCAAVLGSDDAASAKWFPLSALPPLAFDHDRIISDAVALYEGTTSR